jgi:hypothetical protein
LIKQKYSKKSGPDVIEHLKKTSLPLGDSNITGCGYVWAPAALDIGEKKG